jgi:hypothetical protein
MLRIKLPTRMRRPSETCRTQLFNHAKGDAEMRLITVSEINRVSLKTAASSHTACFQVPRPARRYIVNTHTYKKAELWFGADWMFMHSNTYSFHGSLNLPLYDVCTRAWACSFNVI